MATQRPKPAAAQSVGLTLQAAPANQLVLADLIRLLPPQLPTGHVHSIRYDDGIGLSDLLAASSI